MGSVIAKLLRRRGDDEAMNNQPLAEDSLKRGYRYTFRENFDIGQGGGVDVAVFNTGDEQIRTVSVTLIADDLFAGEVDINVDGEGSGTPLPGRNDKINDDANGNPTNFAVESGGTYTGGEAALPIRNYGGRGKNPTVHRGINHIATATARVEPGHSMRWSIDDASTNENTLTFEAVVSRRPAP